MEVIEGFICILEINHLLLSISISLSSRTIYDYYLTSICLQGADGVLVPGGFGGRGVQGKIIAAKYARENRIPYLGICLGMQIAVIEFARSVLGVHDANSTEFDPNAKSPVIIFMPEVIFGTELSRSNANYIGKNSVFFLYVISLNCFV